MAWGNAGNVSTTNLDSGSDSAANARADLKAGFDELKAVINGRAAADGVASLDSGGKVPVAQLPVTPITTGRKILFTAGSSTWTVPAGVTRVTVRLCGGGGGGGYTSVGTGGNHGGGGGGGGFVEKDFTVVAGSSFSYTVGAGGTGKANSSDGDGSDGGDSSVTSPASATPASVTITAKGGTGGKGPGGSRFGGGGGSFQSSTTWASDTDRARQGGAGASGSTLGGMGGASGDGTPAVAGYDTSVHYGGGGGFGSGGGTSAFNGLPGYVEFIW